MRPFLLLLALSVVARAGLHFEPAALDLGTLSTDSPLQSEVWLFNTAEEEFLLRLLPASEDVLVEDGFFSLAAGESLLVQVGFQPTQNTLRQSALLAEGAEGAALLSLQATGDYPGSLWDDSQGLDGEELVEALQAAAGPHTELSYTNARTHMFSTIDNVDGWVEGVYTGFMLQTSGIPDHTVMNTEHTWPQSLFDGSTPRSDLHHLYPTASTVNSARGNLPFGVVVDADNGWPQGGSSRGEDSQGVTVFEPRDEHKGDAARSLFYVALVYDNPYDFLDYQEATLREWSLQDPVDEQEAARNSAIENVQGNRNPFVDHPGLLERIGSLAGNPEPPNTASLALYPDTLDLGEEVWHEECAGSFVIHNSGTSVVSLWSLEADPPLLELGELPSTLEPGEAAAVSFALSETAPFEENEIDISFRSTAGTYHLPFRATLVWVSVDEASARPEGLQLLGAHPNPFNPRTRVLFQLERAGLLQAAVYDLAGRMVEDWPVTRYAAGRHSLEWHAGGAPSGVYLMHLRTEDRHVTQRLLLLK